jgi:hypothetical protein
LKLNRTALVVVGFLLVAPGCKRSASSSAEDNGDQPTPADTAQAPPTPPPNAEPASTAAEPAPPTEKHEEPGVAPSPHHRWVEGYWYWRGGQHLWYGGHWDDADAAPTQAPPALRYEAPGASPGAAYFYAPGYWRWAGSQYAWAPGHWANRRDGYGYAHPYWTYRGGRYYRDGWGYQRRDAAWTARYGGWRAHGDVYVHPRYYNHYVERGRTEGWGRHYR